jgi:hypothetical protein
MQRNRVNNTSHNTLSRTTNSSPKKARYKQPHSDLKEREKGFSVGGNEFISIPNYNALHDNCLKDYFSSNIVKQHLHKKCFVDRSGKALDLEPHNQAIKIIEQNVHKLESQKVELQREQEHERKKQLAIRRHEQEFLERKENYLRRKHEESVRQMNINYLRSNPNLLRSLQSTAKWPFRGDSMDSSRKQLTSSRTEASSRQSNSRNGNSPLRHSLDVSRNQNQNSPFGEQAENQMSQSFHSMHYMSDLEEQFDTESALTEDDDKVELETFRPSQNMDNGWTSTGDSSESVQEQQSNGSHHQNNHNAKQSPSNSIGEESRRSNKDDYEDIDINNDLGLEDDDLFIDEF